MGATAKEMVEALEKFLATNIGVGQVTVDGQTVRYERAQAMTELDYWQRKLAKEQGRRTLFRGFDLGTAW